eukprot:GHVQ01040680.1.p1 GENE.GHVQ01040680.1~~GHVQ01040680.1.p1  ORF type:complete len:196 (+),score=25.26 GHVQ01040680.1:125-712(+)
MELPSAPNEAVSTNVLIKEGEGERVQGQPSQEEDEDEDNKIQTLKLISPHVKLSAGPEWIGAQNRLLSLVQGDYEYYHYKQDGYEDSGWGCCYRGIQMIVSWFTRMDSAHYKNRVPTIRRIQQLLQEKDPAHIDLQVGSKTWIGSVEGCFSFSYACSCVPVCAHVFWCVFVMFMCLCVYVVDRWLYTQLVLGRGM